MSQYKKDMLSALIFLVLGIAVLVAIPNTIVDPQTMKIGPRFFPAFIGWCMVGLSVLLGISTYVKEQKRLKAEGKEVKKEISAEQKKTNRANELRAFTSALIMLVYVLIFDKVGYFISTFIAITAFLVVLKIKKPLPYIICYVAGVAVWACFTYIFSVRLP